MRDALSQLIWNGPRLRGSLPRTLIGALIVMVQGAGPMIGAMIVMGAMVIGAMIEMVQGAVVAMLVMMDGATIVGLTNATNMGQAVGVWCLHLRTALESAMRI